MVIFLELDQEPEAPSHMTLIYKNRGRHYWFDHLWIYHKGIHRLNNLQDGLYYIVKLYRENLWATPKQKVIVRQVKSAPPYGCTCDRFMKFIHTQPVINIRKDELLQMIKESKSFNREKSLEKSNELEPTIHGKFVVGFEEFHT